MKNLIQNTITFSHNDLDGIGVGILVKAAIGESSEVYYCSYQNVDERINKVLDSIEKQGKNYPFILIADLGIKPETAERLDRYKGGKRWLDHHVTNIVLADKYSWATIDTETSGTLLVFDEFENIPRKYSDFALHVDDYDRWVHCLPNSKDLNRLLYIIGINRFEERFLNYAGVVFNESEQLLLEIEAQTIEHYGDRVAKGIQIFELMDGKRLGVGFADRYTSEVAHDLMIRLDLDAIALVDVHCKKMSLRSRNHVNVGEVAKRLGGGGHKNASGVDFNYGTITDFHGSKYPLYVVHSDLESLIFGVFMKVANAYDDSEREALKEVFHKMGVQ